MRAINIAQQYFTHKFRHSEKEVMKCQRQFYALPLIYAVRLGTENKICDGYA